MRDYTLPKPTIEDIRASVVVFLVALPLCLGIALASGAPLLSGVIAGILGGIVVGFISDSGISVSGPAAGLTVIVLGAIAELEGQFTLFTMAVLLSGVLQMVFSFLRLGIMINYVPRSVIKGMLAAIGLILILKQLPHAVGYDADYFGDENFIQPDHQNTLSEVLLSVQAMHLGATLVCAAALVVMLCWDKLLAPKWAVLRLIPSALLAVVLAVVLNLFLQDSPNLVIQGEHLVSLGVSGGFDGFVSQLQLPDWSGLGNALVWKIGITLALVASLESLLSVEASEKLDPYQRKTDKNLELFAQGAGNTISGLVGGLPLTAVIVRTTANVAGGAKTKWSAVFHGVLLLLATVLFAPYVELIPLSALAAILLLVGCKLTPVSLYRDMYAQGKMQFYPFMITIVAILFTDLLTGVILGILAGLGFAIRNSVQNSITCTKDGSEYIVSFQKDASFVQRPLLNEIIDALPAGCTVRFTRAENTMLDVDMIAMLRDFIEQAEKSNRKVMVDDSMQRTGLAAK